MKYCVLLLAPLASGFVITPLVRLRPAFSWQLKATKSTDTPAPLPLGYDKTRAVECAETFGKCSMEEVKNIRDCKLQHTTCIQTSNLSHSLCNLSSHPRRPRQDHAHEQLGRR